MTIEFTRDLKLGRIKTDNRFIDELNGSNSLEPVQLPSGMYVTVTQYLFTYGLAYGTYNDGFLGRYCYEYALDAVAALIELRVNGDDKQIGFDIDPSGPWIKHKGKGIDKLNPNIGANEIA